MYHDKEGAGSAIRRILGISSSYHSRSLYIIVKKTWRKRFTAFIKTANRYSHASPDIIAIVALATKQYLFSDESLDIY